MSGVLDVLKRTGVLWWRCWPMLTAIYLVGWLLRYAALVLAVRVSVNFGGLWGDLVFPLVPLMRLLTYVAMFWLLRRAVTGERLNARDAFDTILRAVLPVFVLFVAWKLHLEDRAAYTSVRYSIYYDSTTEGLSSNKSQAEIEQYLNPTDWRLYAVIAVAFLARLVLTRLRDKLPVWTRLLAVYFEATWVLLIVIAAADKIFGTPDWLKERRAVVWYNDQKDAVLGLLGPFRNGWEMLSQWAGAAIPAVLIPLTWLAIAGAIYGGRPVSAWSSGGKAFFGEDYATRMRRTGQSVLQHVQPRWSRLPGVVQTRAMEFARGLLGIVERLADSIRVALHGGPLVAAAYIFTFMVIVFLYPSGSFYNPQVGEGWLWRLVVHVVGAHEMAWWSLWSPVILLAIASVIEPLKVCLVAATYDYCLERYEESASTSAVTSE